MTFCFVFGRIRAKPESVPLPPAASDLGLDMIESQCAAVCSPGAGQYRQRYSCC